MQFVVTEECIMAANPRQTATFTASATSTAFNFRQFKILLLHIPAGFIGVTMTFTCSDEEGGTYQTLYDDAGAICTITVAASRAVVITDSVKSMAIAGAGWMKLVSSASETLDVQVECTS